MGNKVALYYRGIGILILAGGLLLVAKMAKEGSPKTEVISETEPVTSQESAWAPGKPQERPATPVMHVPAATRPHSPAIQGNQPPTSTAPPAIARPEPDAFTRQLVADLAQPAAEGAHVTSDQVERWKQNLQKLVGQGAGAIPAISEFLSRNVDYDFGTAGKESLGFASARSAMIQALVDIGGADALSAMSEVLGNTAVPRDIALVAQGMDKLAPGQNVDATLAAAREALAMAHDGKLTSQDVAPLFEVITRYGGPGALEELQGSSGNWSYYSVMALASLPEGAGVDALARMAAGSPGSAPETRQAALEMLAQSAPNSPAAQSALLDMVRNNQIPPGQWGVIEPLLAGEQIRFRDSVYGVPMEDARASEMRSTHMSAGNQNLYMALPNGGLSPEQASQYSRLIDDLLAATTDALGREALQRSKLKLASRLPPP